MCLIHENNIIMKINSICALKPLPFLYARYFLLFDTVVKYSRNTKTDLTLELLSEDCQTETPGGQERNYCSYYTTITAYFSASKTLLHIHNRKLYDFYFILLNIKNSQTKQALDKH